MQSPSGECGRRRKRGAGANAFEDADDDLWLALHEEGDDFSISSMIWRTRLPRSIESSTHEPEMGVYFKTTDFPTKPECACDFVAAGWRRFFLFGHCQRREVNRGLVEVARNHHIIDIDEAGMADRNFAANDLADLPFQQFAHALKSERHKWPP